MHGRTIRRKRFVSMSTQDRTFNFKILLILSLGHLVTDIYQGALPAILPFLKAKLSLSYALTGVIMMAANFTSSIIQPLFGHLSDNRDKTALLPLGCVCAGLGLSFVSMPDSFAGVLVLVIISGLGVAAYHPEGYKTAHFFTGERLATGMSVFSVGGNLGFALGPIISISIVTGLGLDFLPVMAVLSLFFLALLLYSWNTLAAARPRALANSAVGGPPARGAYVALFLTIAVVIMRSWTQIGLMTYIPFYYIDHLKGEPIYAGTLVSALLLGGVAGTLGGSVLADRWGHKRYLILSMLVTNLLFPLIFVAQGFWMFIALALVGMVLISSFTVTIVMAQQILPRNLGVASGLMVGFAIGTGGLGVTVLGVVADHFGVSTALHSIMILPVVGLLLSLPIRYPEPGR
jgi:MFS transporter, FSR family, fosmidomycin resistance protein